jgi:hypothetical protein
VVAQVAAVANGASQPWVLVSDRAAFQMPVTTIDGIRSRIESDYSCAHRLVLRRAVRGLVLSGRELTM